jgi:membrane protein implicated in regulation of membrane protease activity
VLVLDDNENSEHYHTNTTSIRRNKKHNQLLGFIVFSVIEESIIGIIAFLAILIFIPFLLLPGVVCVIVGLGLFTTLKIYFYKSSSVIPIENHIVGQLALATEDFSAGINRWTGKVRLRGEIWKAAANTPITQGSKVRVIAVEGLSLMVKPESNSDT